MNAVSYTHLDVYKRQAKHGLIVKGGGTLEQLARVKSAAFDKTGTLTSGRPELTRMVVAKGFDEDRLLQLASSAEVYSSHVLEMCIRDSAELLPQPIVAVTASGTVVVPALAA